MILLRKMDVWRQKNSIVSKLRVKGERLDLVATRLHFERLFGTQDFLPAGLPPKAIICIKNLRDPSPHTLKLNRFDLSQTNAWRNFVAREIEKLFSRAFRPIRETVPAQAQSVVFADNSEMLACLASDWCRESLTQNWWWRSLFPNLQTAQTIAQIWIEAAEFAPFALQILAKQAQAVKFVTKLQPNETADLLRQIITVFGLGKLQAILLEPFKEKKEKLESAVSDEKPIEKRKIPPKTFFFVPQLAPWSKFTPETKHTSLSFEQQSLLGIGLMLARAPRLVRSSEFARQVKIFRAEFEMSRTITGQSKNKILKETRQPEKRQKKFETILRKKLKSSPILPESEVKIEKSSEKKPVKFFEDKTAEKPSEFFDSSSDLESEIISPPEKAKEKAKKIIFKDSPSGKKLERRESKKGTKSDKAKKPKIRQSAFLKARKKAEIEFVEEAETELEVVLETRFGGVFYLLNLALYLNLYRDFTEAGEAEIDLNIWDFVALVALEFLGREIKKDAVWKFLEWLGGRENEGELGKGFTAPDEWRMSPEWLKTFQTGEKWLWMNTGKRLVVRHPAGFSVIDVPLLDDVKAQLENELETYLENFSEFAEGDSKDFRKDSSRSKNWLKNLTEYVQARLLQALNLETREQISRILFERHAKIIVSATHLDANFSLADLPFEVRLSGLDRNPGWIPAVGKFVGFHFI